MWESDFNQDNNKEDHKFKVCDHVRISKYKTFFAKGYTPNWSAKVFVIKKVENTVPRTYVISDLNGEENVATFYEKELQNKTELVEKVIKREGDKLMSSGRVTIIHLIVGSVKNA